MIGYATRTGTRRNVRALHAAGWRQLLTPGQRPTCARGWLLDNGAWGCFQNGKTWDAAAFLRHLRAHAIHADAVVVPDVVSDGRASLDLSRRWVAIRRSICRVALVPVQDGMEPADLEDLVASRGIDGVPPSGGT